MAAPEVRLDRLRPAEIAAAMARAPVAWIPMGALEYHAEHLPDGTDGITRQGLLVRSAAPLGGVALPWSYLTLGTLALPWSVVDTGLALPQWSPPPTGRRRCARRRAHTQGSDRG